MKVPADRLVKSSGFDLVQSGDVGVQHDFLAANDVDEGLQRSGRGGSSDHSLGRGHEDKLNFGAEFLKI
jgi:hypothetical protein